MAQSLQTTTPARQGRRASGKPSTFAPAGSPVTVEIEDFRDTSVSPSAANNAENHDGLKLDVLPSTQGRSSLVEAYPEFSSRLAVLFSNVNYDTRYLEDEAFSNIALGFVYHGPVIYATGDNELDDAALKVTLSYRIATPEEHQPCGWYLASAPDIRWQMFFV
ncbi:hypothetical protein BU23DRAFT_565215 [Bimuria novae-zelandiae CBS 107.79]|uniref:Uncharacterized protein n=1 Tax=Bimuria novae-zelandiae CBS 107.79 TaxID=1447943 RepID=A0A6A5VIK5_9PLEO|nr:hypothetical protein BU23DRAFT_565215 [Bimuria novae-zelandiae CBS 107.79]